MKVEARPIAHVTIKGAGSELPEVKSAVHARAGDTLDRSLLQADVRRLWALGIASQIDVSVTDSDEGPDVELALIAPPRIEQVVGGGAHAELAMLRALEGALYDPERVQRIAALAERRLQANGYLRARVGARADVACGRATVTLDVHTGPRFRISALVVEGSALPVTATTFEGDLGRVNVIGGMLELSGFVYELSRWIDRHHGKGWLEAKASDPDVRYDEARGSVSVHTTIAPGPRYRFGALPIDGGDARGRAIAEAIVAPLRATPYDLVAFQAVAARMRVQLREVGQYANTIATTDTVKRAVEITIQLRRAAP
ncbi:MAG TPA: hypothetical protein VM513_23905 [Kofleriaceae bacterium]|nr:hypothetical protein [Kofleriaceae bacterium]